MDELMAQFIVEARELVQVAIDDLQVIAVDPDNSEGLNGAFRAVHTLKGSTALFDLVGLHSVLHRAENILDLARSDFSILDAERIEQIIQILEWIETCVDQLERDEAISPALLNRARRFELALDIDDRGRERGRDAAASPPAAWAQALALKAGVTCTVALRYQPHPECYFNGDDPIAILSRVPLIKHLSISPCEPRPTSGYYDTFRANLVFEVLTAASVSEVESHFKLIPDQVEIVVLDAGRLTAGTDANQGPEKRETARSLRIDAVRLDTLLRTVGELMTVKNGIGGLIMRAQAIDGGAELARAMTAAQKQLDRVVGTLYQDVLQTRMVPVGQAFRRLPRLVAELSRQLGRPAELVIVGDDIEADKTIVDQLFEPLLHLVRNAMDHGVEPPAERLATGKPVKAELLLQVVEHGEQILLSLSDDGRGIDPSAIRARAVETKRLNAEEAARLDDHATFDLLFVAGFSTAAEISDFSGRGVGLDAVRTEISRLCGSVQISSRPGLGTTFTLCLPVSFAMTQLLLLKVADERYGVPLQSVAETVQVPHEDIMPVRDGKAFIWRDRIVPLLRLAELLGLPQDTERDRKLSVMVLTLETEFVGMVVDSIEERVEVIMKPLEGLLTGAKGIVGTTVLADGQVILILDLAELMP